KPTSCAGGNDGEAFVIVQGGTAPYSYLWNNSQQANDATATNLTQGQYTVTVTDARNCTVTSTVTVGEPTALTITGISMTDVSCLGGSNGTATVTVSGGTGPYQYVWSDANAQTTTTATDLSAGTYTVTVFDNNSCEITNTVTLTEPTTAVSATLSQTFMGCFGAREGEATVMPTGGTAPYTYNWSDGQQTAEAVDLSPIQNFVTVTDANGCTFIDFVEINDLPEITFSLLNSNPTCFGLEDGKMAVNNLNGGIGTGVYTYAWSTVPVQTTEIADNLAGDRSYTVTVTDEQGCIGTDTRILTQPSEIQFDFDATPARCFGEATGTASIINVVSENDITDYQWDLAAANQTTPTATGLATGVYEVTITDANDCAVTKSVDIEQPEPLETEFTVTDNRCFGEDNGVISVDASGGTPGYLYNWSTNDTAEKIGTLLAGTYSLTLTDFNNCTRVDEVEVAQPSAISATLTPDTVGCFGDRNGGIIIDPAGGTPPYLYSLDNENFNGSQNIIGLTAGDYSVYVQDANGCTWFDVATVATPEEFSVDIVGTDGSDLVAVGDSLELFGEVMNAVGDVEYIWSSAVADVLSCNECSSTFVKPMNTLYVEVYAVDANGCEAEDRLQVMVKKDRVVLVPTGFTPDANGRNDKLMVHGAEGSMIKTFRVFDRWGEQMYEQNEFSINDQSAGWDGNFRSRPAPAGVYVWYLEVEYIDGVREILKGNTTLIR
ncbi:MAG: gliding motility-associated C-terminal domain-containing protein, partial [Bacteroidota bacterium]